jgi:peroxiredoxin (alkyl hydroperoxide reductase subunit C)
MSLINTEVIELKNDAFHNGKFHHRVQRKPSKARTPTFMPAAFTFNRPTEVQEDAANHAEFQKAGAEVYIVTTDPPLHKVWHETSPAGKAKFPDR